MMHRHAPERIQFHAGAIRMLEHDDSQSRTDSPAFDGQHVMNPEVREPIFVVGIGRSGSTVFFDILARHPDVVWLSKLSRDYPNHPWLNRMLMRFRSLAIVDRLLTKKLGPAEAYPFWDLNCPGFSNPCRDLVAEDVMPIAATRLRASVADLVSRKQDRFLAKITGWPRVSYLREIFPHAVFLEVTRDPCATVSSLLEVAFWDGWRGPPNWRRGPLPPDLAALWRQEGESFVALAAIEFLIYQRAMDQCRATLPSSQLHTVSYTQLCAEPVNVFREVARFCCLPWSKRFEKSIGRVRLVNRDDKWRKTLTASQQDVLLRTLKLGQGFESL
jgi:sulfotransferase family protein